MASMAVKIPTKAVIPIPMMSAVRVALRGFAFMLAMASKKLVKLNTSENQNPKVMNCRLSTAGLFEGKNPLISSRNAGLDRFWIFDAF
jgi:hypothetical protein